MLPAMIVKSQKYTRARLSPLVVLLATGWMFLGLVYVTGRSVWSLVVDWVSEYRPPWPPREGPEAAPRIEPTLFPQS